MRSSAAASTTGSTTPTASANSKSCALVPQASAALTEQVAQFVNRLRSQPFSSAFQRTPAIAESVEWAKALVALDALQLDPELVQDTAGVLFKQREDVAALTADVVQQALAPEEA